MLEWLERNRSNIAALLVVLVTVAAVALLQLPHRAALQVVSPSTPPTPIPIKVHVVGSVLSPGVYSLPVDARMEDALRAAGGATGSADLASLNLAAPLRDGQQVVIHEAGAPEPSSYSAARPAPSPPTSKLDLNSASLLDLDQLPGVGLVTAQKILEYRQKNGRFVSIEELKDAKLVNSATYDRIKGLVEVPSAMR